MCFGFSELWRHQVLCLSLWKRNPSLLYHTYSKLWFHALEFWNFKIKLRTIFWAFQSIFSGFWIFATLFSLRNQNQELRWNFVLPLPGGVQLLAFSLVGALEQFSCCRLKEKQTRSKEKRLIEAGQGGLGRPSSAICQAKPPEAVARSLASSMSRLSSWGTNVTLDKYGVYERSWLI